MTIGIYVTFDTVTDESAEYGETASAGWWEPGDWRFDDKPDEPAFVFDPEDVDADEHDALDEAIVAWAVGILREQGACHPACYPPVHAGWWGTEGNEVLDYATGETIRKSFHLDMLTDEQREAVNRRMCEHAW